MKMIVLGTAHDFQCHDPRLKSLIGELVIRENVTVIAEKIALSQARLLVTYLSQ